MSSIKPRCFLCCDEKLRSISIFSCICHGQPSNSIMLQLEILIREPLTINTASTSTIFIGEITPLDHKISDDSMEEGALESLTSWFFRKLNEIFYCLWDCFPEKTNLNSANRFLTNCNIKPDLRRIIVILRYYTRYRFSKQYYYLVGNFWAFFLIGGLSIKQA